MIVPTHKTLYDPRGNYEAGKELAEAGSLKLWQHINLHYDNTKSLRTGLPIGLSLNFEGFSTGTLWARLK
jgi:hypothetical protein